MKQAHEVGMLSGVFAAMQYLVLSRDEPSLAVELGEQHRLTREWMLKESKATGYEVRRMNKFIRNNF